MVHRQIIYIYKNLVRSFKSNIFRTRLRMLKSLVPSSNQRRARKIFYTLILGRLESWKMCEEGWEGQNIYMYTYIHICRMHNLYIYYIANDKNGWNDWHLYKVHTSHTMICFSFKWNEDALFLQFPMINSDCFYGNNNISTM